MPDAPARLLVIADADDLGARAVAAAVRRSRGNDSVEVVVAAELTATAIWEHRIRDGRARSRVRLVDGRVLDDSPAGAVLNRIGVVAGPQLATRPDREYAAMELHALLLSWLAGLACPVLNPPSPVGLGGARRGELDWLAVGSRLGLPVRTVRVTTDPRGVPRTLTHAAGAGGSAHTSEATGHPMLSGDGLFSRWSPPAIATATVLVAGERVLDAPARTAAMCRQLAAGVVCPVLEVTLVREQTRGWVIAGADPLPALSDPDHVAAVVDLIDQSASW